MSTVVSVELFAVRGQVCRKGNKSKYRWSGVKQKLIKTTAIGSTTNGGVMGVVGSVV
jgi:hypothetical protein